MFAYDQQKSASEDKNKFIWPSIDNSIIRYYRLCSVRNGRRELVIGQMGRINTSRPKIYSLSDLFSEEEIKIFTRVSDGALVAHENVIGGSESDTNVASDQSYNQKILIL